MSSPMHTDDLGLMLPENMHSLNMCLTTVPVAILQSRQFWLQIQVPAA